MVPIIETINKKLIKDFYTGVEITKESVEKLVAEQNVVADVAVWRSYKYVEAKTLANFVSKAEHRTSLVISIVFGGYQRSLLELSTHSPSTYELCTSFKGTYKVSFNSLFSGLMAVSSSDSFYASPSLVETFVNSYMTPFDMQCIATTALSNKDLNLGLLAKALGERLKRISVVYENNSIGDILITLRDAMDFRASGTVYMIWKHADKTLTIQYSDIEVAANTFSTLEEFETWFNRGSVISKGEE